MSDGAKLTNKLGDYVIGANCVLQLSEEWPLNVVSAVTQFADCIQNSLWIFYFETGNRKSGYKIKLKGFNDLTRVGKFGLKNFLIFSFF